MRDASTSYSSQDTHQPILYILLLPHSLLWNVIYIVVMLCGIYVCWLQYRRYLANPAVVSVERDFYDWNGTLPSLTFCYRDNNLQLDKADEFIERTWNLSAEIAEHNETHHYYLEFLNLLTEADIYTVGELLRFQEDPTLQRLDLAETIKSVISDHDHYVSSFDRDWELAPQRVQTERGICYTVNSVQQDFPHQLSSSSSSSLRTNKTAPLQCNFIQDQCFMKLDVFGFNASVAIHSFYEPVRYETSFYELGHVDEIVTTFKLLETINDGLVRELTYPQRKCLFYEETEGVPQEKGKERNPLVEGEEVEEDVVVTGGSQRAITVDEGGIAIYSLNLCLLKCRAEVAIALCGCKPHFYPFLCEW